jgi:hypothetical protein
MSKEHVRAEILRLEKQIMNFDQRKYDPIKARLESDRERLIGFLKITGGM